MLSAAALMIGAIGFAQVPGAQQATAVANQNPTGAPLANTTETDQYGTDQRLEVTQVGVLNSARVYQSDAPGSLADHNEVRISQDGPNGYLWPIGSFSSAYNNEAEANQKGINNESSINQKGWVNDARTEQGTQGIYSTGNKILVQQGVSNSVLDISEGNYAYGVQNGSYNQSLIQQNDDNNDAWTNQTGNYNMVQVTQSSDPGVFSANEGQLSRAIQSGNSNMGKIVQEGDGARNEAYLNQYGDSNDSYQFQNAESGVAGEGNTATVNQGSYSYDAEAYQSQIGEENTVTMNQYGGTTYASNHGEQVQDGDDNTATMTQNYSGIGYYGIGDDNYGRQYQEGDDNDATLAQTGEGNKALQVQDGNDNYVLSGQNGNDNKLNTHQIGSDNYAITAQWGRDNSGLVVQYGGQSANMFQSGNGNSANIFQAGPFGGASIDCGFDNPLDIPNPTPVPDITVSDPCATGNCN